MTIAAYNPYQTLAKEGQPLAYLYDESFEGILTCVYLSLKARETPTSILGPRNLQLQIGQIERTVETDMTAAMQVRRSILRSYGQEVFDHLSVAAASDNPDAPLTVFTFTKRLLGNCRECACCPKKGSCTSACAQKQAPSVLNNLADPVTHALESLRRQVLNEREKMVQFIRFQHLENGIWFARCNPNAKVIPLLMPWFSARFNTQQFVIFDETHKMSGVWNGRSWGLVIGDVTPPDQTANDLHMQDAWVRYFNSLCISERYNPELQMKQMPKRLWKNITEMQMRMPA